LFSKKKLEQEKVSVYNTENNRMESAILAFVNISEILSISEMSDIRSLVFDLNNP